MQPAMPHRDESSLFTRLRRPRLASGLAIGIGAYVLLFFATGIGWRLRFISAWDIGATSALLLLFVGLRRSSAATMKRIAARQDAGKWAVLILTLVAATASFVVIAAEMPVVKEAVGVAQAVRVLLMVYTIVLSWAFIQIVFALHYANDYYAENEQTGPDACARPGGVAFPGDRTPTYGDFLYFSFTIGMTFQVSDVQITDPSVRRVALAHGIVSFLYSTGILALTINLVAGLI